MIEASIINASRCSCISLVLSSYRKLLEHVFRYICNRLETEHFDRAHRPRNRLKGPPQFRSIAPPWPELIRRCFPSAVQGETHRAGRGLGSLYASRAPRVHSLADPSIQSVHSTRLRFKVSWNALPISLGPPCNAANRCWCCSWRWAGSRANHSSRWLVSPPGRVQRPLKSFHAADL